MRTTLIRRTTLASLGLLTVMASQTALAHTGVDAGQHHASDVLSSFAEGALHPLTGLDHLAAMLSVGLWSTLSQRSPMSAPLAFATTLLIGALLAMAGVSLPGVEPMIAASVLVMGLLVATRAHLPTAAGAALVAAFALFHGLAHGQELGSHGLTTLAGMVLSTAVLHAVGMGLGWALKHRTGMLNRWAPRLAGIGIAAFGLSLLNLA
ncbi:MAG: HupE/UreJ family protein [Pseudomonadota bacterium]